MISGYVSYSLNEWFGNISTVVFMSKCNLRCPFCHNHLIFDCNGKVDKEDLIGTIRNQQEKGFLDGVVLSGGEPTIHEELFELIKDLKKITRVKLHTNGTNPTILKRLLKDNVLDCLAIDYKTSIDNLNKETTGVEKDYRDLFLESLSVLNDCKIEKEVHTTLIPNFINEKFINDIGVTLNKNVVWILQKFENKNSFKLKDADVFSDLQVDRFKDIASKHVEKVFVV